jgi:hypothetical protein
MNPRTFPGPWRVEASEGAFAVTDAKGFAVAYLYWKPHAAELMTRSRCNGKSAIFSERLGQPWLAWRLAPW